MSDPQGQKSGDSPSPEPRSKRRGGPDPRGRIERRASGLHTFFTRDLWSRELATLPTFRRWVYGTARVVQLTATNFVKDRCTWRAAALTYITVLSLVPMLALGFSVAKGLGAYETLLTKTIVPFLDSTFGPAEGVPLVSLPEQDDEEAAAIESDEPSDEVTGDGSSGDEADSVPEAVGGSEVRKAIDTVLSFVQKTDVSRLGVFGLLIVIYTVIQLLGAIERSFNDIWGVTKSRTLPRKLADYLSTIVLVPLLLVTGTGVLSLARSGWLAEYTGRGDSPLFALFSSLAVIWIGFAFAYILMPNTRTRVVSALVGGVVGGTMWQIFQYAHLQLQVGVANYNAIYSTFAALPIFLFWVHSSWMTVLLGAEAAAAHQNQARHGQLVRSREFDLALKETVALRLATRVTCSFLDGAPPTSMELLADEIGCPDRTLEEVARGLESARILATVEVAPEEPGLVLASDPDRVRMQDVFDALKGENPGDEALGPDAAFQGEDAVIGAAFRRFRSARDASDENLTLRQLSEL
ncbi:MAG: YihY/virulence factor BrkB family protein [Planctomycetota bacterium]